MALCPYRQLFFFCFCSLISRMGCIRCLYNVCYGWQNPQPVVKNESSGVLGWVVKLKAKLLYKWSQSNQTRVKMKCCGIRTDFLCTEVPWFSLLWFNRYLLCTQQEVTWDVTVWVGTWVLHWQKSIIFVSTSVAAHTIVDTAHSPSFFSVFSSELWKIRIPLDTWYTVADLILPSALGD